MTACECCNFSGLQILNSSQRWYWKQHSRHLPATSSLAKKAPVQSPWVLLSNPAGWCCIQWGRVGVMIAWVILLEMRENWGWGRCWPVCGLSCSSNFWTLNQRFSITRANGETSFLPAPRAGQQAAGLFWAGRQEKRVEVTFATLIRPEASKMVQNNEEKL